MILCYFTLSRSRPEHYPLLLEIKTHNVQLASTFKFLKAWSLHKGCKELIVDSWGIVGCPMYVLSSKLKNLKVKLKRWNKDVFGNIHSAVIEAENMLKEVQDQIQLQGHKLDETLHKQDIIWQEKARVNWHLNGDRNSKYFHRVTKIKNKTKIISNIRNNDEILSNPLRLSEHIIAYYKNLFVSSNSFL